MQQLSGQDASFIDSEGVGTRLGARFARRGEAGVVNTVVTNVPGPRLADATRAPAAAGRRR